MRKVLSSVAVKVSASKMGVHGKELKSNQPWRLVRLHVSHDSTNFRR